MLKTGPSSSTWRYIAFYEVRLSVFDEQKNEHMLRIEQIFIIWKRKLDKNEIRTNFG